MTTLYIERELNNGSRVKNLGGYCSQVEIITFLKVHCGDLSTLVKLLNKQQKFEKKRR